jgi:hypothetical protein
MVVVDAFALPVEGWWIERHYLTCNFVQALKLV